jgi:DNA-binding transcriptional LysR family regulator
MVAPIASQLRRPQESMLSMYAVRGLEERLGVRLLARTTRIVAPTHAGEQLISRLRPALGDVDPSSIRSSVCASGRRDASGRW